MENEKPIYQLVYMSKSKHDNFNAKELDEVLATSRRNNTRRGVTGLLLYHKGTFLQILEGPERTVEAIYRVIQYDPRHVGLKTVAKRYLDKADFPDWSMSFRNLDEDSASAEKAGFNTFLSVYNPKSLDDSEMSPEVSKLLSKFRTIWVEGQA